MAFAFERRALLIAAAVLACSIGAEGCFGAVDGSSVPSGAPGLAPTPRAPDAGHAIPDSAATDADASAHASEADASSEASAIADELALFFVADVSQNAADWITRDQSTVFSDALTRWHAADGSSASVGLALDPLRTLTSVVPCSDDGGCPTGSICSSTSCQYPESPNGPDCSQSDPTDLYCKCDALHYATPECKLAFVHCPGRCAGTLKTCSAGTGPCSLAGDVECVGGARPSTDPERFCRPVAPQCGAASHGPLDVPLGSEHAWEATRNTLAAAMPGGSTAVWAPRMLDALDHATAYAKAHPTVRVAVVLTRAQAVHDDHCVGTPNVTARVADALRDGGVKTFVLTWFRWPNYHTAGASIAAAGGTVEHAVQCDPGTTCPGIDAALSAITSAARTRP